VRTLHEQGMSYRAIAQKLGMPRSTVSMLCEFSRRAIVPLRLERLSDEFESRLVHHHQNNRDVSTVLMIVKSVNRGVHEP